MAISKLHILLVSLIYFALISTQIRSDDVAVDGGGGGVSIGSDDSEAFKVELDKLTSKIQSLESLVNEKTEELKSKDEVIAGKEKAIAEKENLIKEKLDSITSLQSEITSLQVKGSSDAKEQIEKANTRSKELEKQVEKLQLELDLKSKLREGLETRAQELEKQMVDMNPKLQDLQKTIDEQKSKLIKTERALKVAEEELTRTKDEATLRITELTQIHSAWLPPWLARHVSCCQSSMETRWKVHGKPALDALTLKALEKKAQAEKWAEPHMVTIKTKWVPAAKKQWATVITNVEPRVKFVTEKTTEVYVKSKEALTPHAIKIKEVVDPHFQVAKKFCKPYVDQIAVATKPHLDKGRECMEPYTKQAVLAYGKFLESATKYHNQVQGTIEESLKQYELTNSLATKELIWFTASAVFVLPFIILFRTLSVIFFGKAKKPNRNGKPTHSRRKAKRGHSDK